MLKYNGDKLPLWTKASYGGQVRLNGNPSGPYFDPFGFLHLSRSTYGETFIRYDMGRCSLQTNKDLSTCDGNRAESYTGVLVPGIFERWEQPTPLSYILHINPRVLWPAIPPMNRTDRRVTAEDAVWYMQTQRDHGIQRDFFGLTETIQAVDRSTVKVTMKSPDADFIRALASSSMAVTPPECWPIKVCSDKFVFISPGPYIWKEFVPRERTLYEKNAEWHFKGAPWVDSFRINNIADPAAAKSAFVTGQIDLGAAPTPGEIDTLTKQVPGVQIFFMSSATGFWHFRAELKGPLADVRVRRALVQGTDFNSLWQATGGVGIFPMSLPYEYLGLTFPVGLKDAGPYFTFNPEAARKLLADAGYPNGFDLTIWTAQTSGFGADMNVAFQDQWQRNLNVKAKIRVIDFTSHLQSLFESKWEGLWHAICWVAYCGSVDPSSFMLQEVTGSKQNYSKVNDPVIDALFAKQRAELDPAKRSELLWQYQRYTWEQLYTIPIHQWWQFGALQPWEMNAMSHAYAALGAPNGAMYTHMLDLSKMPKR
jgi:ABC-type transport system substrate-binding protein